MFEPHPFSDKPTGQDALIIALQERDMKAFETALADPEVDPDYWYGKPYWTTCLQLAARTEGCEAFVMALLRAGAGDVRSRNRPRTSETATSHSIDRIAKFLQNGGGDDIECEEVNGEMLDLEFSGGFGPLAAPAGACVCGAQEARAAEAEAAPKAEATTKAAAAAAGSGGPDGMTRGEHMLGLRLRDMNRALRDTADQMSSELHALALRVEQLGERVAAMERAQAHTNELLALRLKR